MPKSISKTDTLLIVIVLIFLGAYLLISVTNDILNDRDEETIEFEVPKNISLGGESVILIRISGLDRELESIFINAKFDPEALRIDGINRGNLFDQEGVRSEFNYGIYNRQGVFIISAERLTRIFLDDREGIIAEMTVTGLSPGMTEIEIADMAVFGFDSNSINYKIESQIFNVTE